MYTTNGTLKSANYDDPRAQPQVRPRRRQHHLRRHVPPDVHPGPDVPAAGGEPSHPPCYARDRHDTLHRPRVVGPHSGPSAPSPQAALPLAASAAASVTRAATPVRPTPSCSPSPRPLGRLPWRPHRPLTHGQAHFRHGRCSHGLLVLVSSARARSSVSPRLLRLRVHTAIPVVTAVSSTNPWDTVALQHTFLHAATGVRGRWQLVP